MTRGGLNLTRSSKRFRPPPTPLSRLHPKRRGGRGPPVASPRRRSTLFVPGRLAIPAALVSVPLGARSRGSPERSCRPEFQRGPVRRFALGSGPLLSVTQATRAREPFRPSLPRRRRSRRLQYPSIAIPVGRRRGTPGPAGRPVTGTFNNLFHHRFLCINWTAAHRPDGHNGPLSSTFEGFTHRAEGFHTK